jgi:hypothetical protein
MHIDNGIKNQLRTFLGIALAVAVGIVGANAAAAGFDDVPSEGQFAESVSRVQEAGIATGFSDGTFRPTTALNRQQAAAWLDRSMSVVGYDWNHGGQNGAQLNSATPTAAVAAIDMTSRAAGDGGGWVTIQGGVGAVSAEPGATCPCVVDILVKDDTDRLIARSVVTAMADPTGRAVTISPIFAVVPLAAGEAHTYRVEASLADTTQSVRVGAIVYGLYSPMAEGTPTSMSGESGRPVSEVVQSLVP